ncbi:uncharacterized protein LOC128203683 [Mya arenaria]|uniref:uncharacterized protein LOC128203683 n=1 Tax=Mya arenaria TaxID=6604 RepID=UPI0022E1FF6A|nr:uncharacterized protein LOC128203683 [Mya arenaria]
MCSLFPNEDAPASARSSSANRTKQLVHISAWATRILAFLSIILVVVTFTIQPSLIASVMCVTAVFSILSPLNFNACCYSDCSRNTKFEKRCGLVSVFVWMFFLNGAYIIVFALCWDFWFFESGAGRYKGMDLLNTVFAFALIINIVLTILNLYSICLVYMYGCCFMNGVDRECSQQSFDMMDAKHSQLSTIGGGVPVNGSGLTMPIGPQQGQIRTTTSFPQPQPHLSNMPLSLQPAPQQQAAGGVTAYSASLSIPNSMPMLEPDANSQNEAPPSYPEAVLNDKHSC